MKHIKPNISTSPRASFCEAVYRVVREIATPRRALEFTMTSLGLLAPKYSIHKKKALLKAGLFHL